MKFDPRILRTVLIWTVILAATLVSGLAAILETGILTPRIIDWVNERLEKEGGLHVEATSVYLRPWSGLSLDDVWLTIPSVGHPSVVSSEPGQPPTGGRVLPSFGGSPRNSIFSVAEIEIGYRVSGLLRGSPRLKRVRLVSPDLDVTEFRRWLSRRAEASTDEKDDTTGAVTPALRIDDLRIMDGRIETGGGSVLSGLRLAGRIDRRDGNWRLIADDAGAHLASDNIEEDLELTGVVAFGDEGARLDGLHLGVAGGRLSFEGVVDVNGGASTSVRATGYALSLEHVGSWFGASHPLLDADFEFRLHASGRTDSLEMTGSFRGVTEEGSPRNFQLAGVRREDRVDVELLRVEAGDSRLDVTGQLRLGPTPGMNGVAVFRDLDLALVLGGSEFSPLGPLDGIVRFGGTGFRRDTFDGQAEVSISRTTLLGLPIDSAEFRPSMKDGELQLTSATIRKGHSVVTGIGSIDAENRVVAELEGTIADLADLGEAFGDAATGALEGQATAELRILGPINGPALEAVLRFEDASVLGAQASTLEFGIAVERLGPDTVLDIEAVGTGIGYGGREIPRATGNGTLNGGELSVKRLRLESDRRGALTLAGDVMVAGDSLSGQIGQLEIVPADGGAGWSNEGTIRIERTGETLLLSGLDLRRGSGLVTADIRFEGVGEILVNAAGENVDLSVFAPFLLTPKPLAGILDFQADATIGEDTLAVDLDVDLLDGAWGDDSLEAIQGRFSLRDDRAVFDEMIFRSSVAIVDLEGELLMPTGSFREVFGDSTARTAALDRMECRGLQARMESPDWSWFWNITPWPDMGGAGTAVLKVDGPAAHPTADLWARLVSGNLGPEPLEEFVGVGRYADDRITIDEGRIRSGAGLLEVEGGLPITWSFAHPNPQFAHGDPYDLKMKGTSFPVRGLAAFVPLFEMVQGIAEADLTLSGVPDSAYFLGEFSLTDGRLTIPTFVDPLVGGEVTGHFDRQGVEIVEARMKDGLGGRVTGHGRVELANLQAKDWQIDVEASNYHYRGEINGIVGIGSGSLAIEAVPQPEGAPLPRYVGEFDVKSAQMDERVLAPPASVTAVPDMPAGVNAPDPIEEEIAAREAAAEEIVPPPLVFAEIDFRAGDNLWLRTREHQVEMEGEVTLHSTPEYIGLTGDLSVLRGTYSVLNTVFDIDRAEVRFFDPSDPEATQLDAEATTRVLEEEVTATVTGTLLFPVIRLSTESGMTEAEIMELLALRMKRTETGGVTDASSSFVSSQLVSSWGAALASRFGRELSREVGIDIDTFDVVQGDAGATIGVGKSLGSNLFLRYRQEVGVAEDPAVTETYRERLETPERQLLLEYRLSRILQLQGETGTIQGDGYLNVDLKAEWGY